MMFPLLMELKRRRARDVLDEIFGEDQMTAQDLYDGLSKLNENVTKEMTDALFESFDLDSSSSLSKQELAGGLSLTCMGDLEDRISFAFEQYVLLSLTHPCMSTRTHAKKKKIRRR